MRDRLIRIVLWASAGFFVSLGWGFYFANANKGIPIASTVYALATLTQPTAAIVLYLKPNLPLGLTWVAVANAATYAMLGLMVETIRQHYRPAHPGTQI